MFHVSCLVYMITYRFIHAGLCSKIGGTVHPVLKHKTTVQMGLPVIKIGLEALYAPMNDSYKHHKPYNVVTPEFSLLVYSLQPHTLGRHIYQKKS